PEALKSGLRWQAVLEEIVRSAPHAAAATALLHSDRRQLASLQLPQYAAVAGQSLITDTDGLNLALSSELTPLQRIYSRVERLGGRDLRDQILDARQIRKIRDACQNTAALRHTAVPCCPDDFDSLVEYEITSISSALRAVVLGREGGRLTWLAPRGEASPRPMVPVNIDVFHGSAGIALFLAANAAVRGVDADREIALEWARQVTRRGQIDQIWSGIVHAVGERGWRGAPGVVYALSRCGTFLGDDSIADIANRLSLRLACSGIDDGWQDVIDGAAGSILVMMAFYETLRAEHLLRRAYDGALALISNRYFDRFTRAHVWRIRCSGSDQQFVGSGFAHGSSGIAAALSAVYRHVGDPRVRAAILEARQFEDTMYCADENNWFDQSPPSRAAEGNRVLMRAWCHGAVGIELSRLLTDIDLGLTTANVEGHVSVPGRTRGANEDTLCCGALGMTDLLLTAGERLHRPELVARAKAICFSVMNERRARGRTGVTPVALASPPGLFNGSAGVGYQLLRLAAPKAVPSVLLIV
ncbi:MAG: hypothetical protein M3081_20065, partial [Gemmatimonadota bacterium]|nr:hypothetical protein [Gemmatimonadota bacterium]